MRTSMKWIVDQSHIMKEYHRYTEWLLLMLQQYNDVSV